MAEIASTLLGETYNPAKGKVQAAAATPRRISKQAAEDELASQFGQATEFVVSKPKDESYFVVAICILVATLAILAFSTTLVYWFRVP